ncbi:transmembrane protein [Ceratobasidium sp. AG-Ba]|nr:transmembrane protein [Ceratobasidium sp. AG-Ba]
MFPNGQKFIPKTNAERVEAQPNIQQPPDGIRVQIEDPEDPPGEEMAKTARVWKTYVREADRWDKEIVDGQNSSLDVLPIFAALFSAISTALVYGFPDSSISERAGSFIIESLGDLKPDTTESSARSLLAISQKLDAIVTGQPLTSLPAPTPSLDNFSPSHSAVMVNILWLLSLSLSVAVSLISMLAKEWCYKFMMGRSGPIYNQARRRQQNWNGIERWKMQELVNALPGLMHAALLLFAVGLCIYLWDIHTGVAIVVTAVTAIVGCIYVLTTLLPLFDRFCPYSTPVTPILGFLRRMMYLAVSYGYQRTEHVNWLQYGLGYTARTLNPDHRDDDSGTEGDQLAHMDIVTSQMLAWMIANCEDSRSVDIALQAISGARAVFPLGPLKECEAYYSTYDRVKSLVQVDAVLQRYELRNPSMLRTALRYCRALSVFMREPLASSVHRVPQAYYYFGIKTHMSLFERIANDITDETRLHLDVNVAACIIYASWDWETFFSKNRSLAKISFESVTARASEMISDYASHSTSGISVPVATLFLESYGHFMISCGLILKDPKTIPNVAQLVRIFLQANNPNGVIRAEVSSALAAAAFAVNSYPGGNQPSTSADEKGKRAVQVLDHYQNLLSQFYIEEDLTFHCVPLLV